MTPRVSVVIPCYRVKAQILAVIEAIGADVSHIFAVDDKCPEETGRFVETHVRDPRVSVLFHESNEGVGGAVITGYRAALDVGADIVVKIDGDGQMDPRLLPRFLAPILNGDADYTKGNRFYSIYNVRRMPLVRLIGSATLSLLTKLSSGYWSVFDPTNGYTAIHSDALRRLELQNLSKRYFFESDMLIHLGDIRAVVVDVFMESKYDDEESNLRIKKIVLEFMSKHLKGFFRRVLYSYFLRDFSIASLNLLGGTIFFSFGLIFGLVEWWRSASADVAATSGTVMIAALPIILGFQMLLSFLSYDIANEPRRPLIRQRWLGAPPSTDSPASAAHAGNGTNPMQR